MDNTRGFSARQSVKVLLYITNVFCSLYLFSHQIINLTKQCSKTERIKHEQNSCLPTIVKTLNKGTFGIK